MASITNSRGTCSSIRIGLLVMLLLMVPPAVIPAMASPMLYAVTRGSELFTIDGATGISTLVGTIGGAAVVNEIEIDPVTGRAYILFGTSRSQTLQEINLLTATLIGSPVSLFGESSSLEFVGSTLYGSCAVDG